MSLRQLTTPERLHVERQERKVERQLLKEELACLNEELKQAKEKLKNASQQKKQLKKELQVEKEKTNRINHILDLPLTQKQLKVMHLAYRFCCDQNRRVQAEDTDESTGEKPEVFTLRNLTPMCVFEDWSEVYWKLVPNSQGEESIPNTPLMLEPMQITDNVFPILLKLPNAIIGVISEYLTINEYVLFSSTCHQFYDARILPLSKMVQKIIAQGFTLTPGLRLSMFDFQNATNHTWKLTNYLKIIIANFTAFQIRKKIEDNIIQSFIYNKNEQELTCQRERLSMDLPNLYQISNSFSSQGVLSIGTATLMGPAVLTSGKVWDSLHLPHPR